MGAIAIYRVRHPKRSDLFLFSGSGASRWSRVGKTWGVPRNVVFAIESSSDGGVDRLRQDYPPTPKASDAGDVVVWKKWLKATKDHAATNWRRSFRGAKVVAISFHPDTGMAMTTEFPIKEFLKKHGGRRWREL